MKTTIKQIDGSSFAALAQSNHWTILDSAVEDGGNAGGTGPMEMVLNSLGCCSGIDILLILKKMRVVIDDIEINIEADRSEEHPRVFTKVHLEYMFEGPDLKRHDLERAIQLSLDKYCSVAGMVSKTAEITSSFKIV